MKVSNRNLYLLWPAIIDESVKSLLGRHPGESRGPEIYESGFLFSQETLDSGFRRNDVFYGILNFYEIIIIEAGEPILPSHHQNINNDLSIRQLVIPGLTRNPVLLCPPEADGFRRNDGVGVINSAVDN